MSYFVQFFRNIDSKNPYDEKDGYDYQRIRQKAYSFVPKGSGYQEVYQLSVNSGGVGTLKGTVYRNTVNGKQVIVYEFPSGSKRILNRNGSFGQYIR